MQIIQYDKKLIFGVVRIHSFFNNMFYCSGTRCEENINECSGGPCLNGGSCVDGVGSHQCSCATGFTGDNCQTNIDECSLNVCAHAVSCRDLVSDK